MTIAAATIGIAPPGKTRSARSGFASPERQTKSARRSWAATNMTPVAAIVSDSCLSMPPPSTEMSGGIHHTCIAKIAAVTSVMTVTTTAKSLPTLFPLVGSGLEDEVHLRRVAAGDGDLLALRA